MNKHIDKCGYSSNKIYMIFAILFITTIAIVLFSKTDKVDQGLIEQQTPPCVKDSTDSVFVPTVEDRVAQDSVWVIVKQTELEVDTIHIRIDRIEQKIDDLIEDRGIDTTSYIDDIMDDMDMDCGGSDEWVLWKGDNGIYFYE
jgi:hypothetical protein